MSESPDEMKIHSRAIEIEVPENLNWPSKKWMKQAREQRMINFSFLDKRDKNDKICNLERISDAVKVLLESIGEDVGREGLLKTPERYAKALLFMTKGYTEDLEGIYLTIYFTLVDYLTIYLCSNDHFTLNFRVDKWCSI